MKMDLISHRLRDKYGQWGEHPKYPAGDWRYEVQNNDTRLGYWAWVVAQMDKREISDEA